MRADERGAMTVLVAAVSLILALVAAGAADLGALLVARVRAQTAADSAALAAASALSPLIGEGADPEIRAGNAAAANGARLVGCVCQHGAADAVVEVEITASAMFVRAWDGATVRASARAEIDRDVYSYRG